MARCCCRTWRAAEAWQGSFCGAGCEVQECMASSVGCEMRLLPGCAGQGACVEIKGIICVG